MLFLAACGGTRYEEEKEKSSPIPFQVSSPSAAFSSFITLSVDTGDHCLIVRFGLGDPKKLHFPVSAAYKDTLTATAFEFQFLEGGKPLLLDRATVYTSENGGKWSYYGKEIFSELRFATDTVDIRRTASLSVNVPYYAFQKIKRGSRELEVRISQRTFCSSSERAVSKRDSATGDTITMMRKFYAQVPMFSATAKFKLNIPSVYQTTLIGQGIVLRNDSGFSPAGMDNTIWKSSYPDIYWSIYFPKGIYYAKTDFEKSTDRYSSIDTFQLYHYTASDIIGFGVWDHDNLSRDDYLGDWEGSLKKLVTVRQANLGFGNVKWFGIRAVPVGIINK